jgi:hypothetical protein
MYAGCQMNAGRHIAVQQGEVRQGLLGCGKQCHVTDVAWRDAGGAGALGFAVGFGSRGCVLALDRHWACSRHIRDWSVHGTSSLEHVTQHLSMRRPSVRVFAACGRWCCVPWPTLARRGRQAAGSPPPVHHARHSACAHERKRAHATHAMLTHTNPRESPLPSLAGVRHRQHQPRSGRQSGTTHAHAR